MYEHVKKLFDLGADGYDWQRRSLIPDFDQFYGMAVSLIRPERAAPSILDLGAGTGLLTSFVAAACPQAKLTLIDFSEKMLDQARKRFERHPAEVRFITGDYAEREFPETYDYVVSSLSIHHLEHADKQKLFKKIYRVLRPGGAFINADQAAGETPFFEAFNLREWEREVAATGLPPELIEASKERRKQDRNATVSDQLRWLREAGFADADSVYKRLGFAVFYAPKAK
ncbi:class I SAM-dependent methyltransferase [Cohnella massiliensis]|uniref:class I SAM-dependent methyltransferase n=1 Tax=Cohnella massiliensis TaxID=1816691 RepID=UPI0009BC1795|nr:class I SAM-dependent methyltransferase [Cohnella massiliensis]